MVDGNVTMMDEECMCCCKIAGLRGGVGVVENFSWSEDPGREEIWRTRGMPWEEMEEAQRLGGAISAIAISSGTSIIIDWAISKGLDGGPSTQ